MEKKDMNEISLDFSDKQNENTALENMEMEAGSNPADLGNDLDNKTTEPNNTDAQDKEKLQEEANAVVGSE